MNKIGYLCAMVLAFVLGNIGCQQDVANMKRQANSFVIGLGYELKENSEPQCQDYDSDGDGYVSCTVAVKGGNPMAIECKSDYALGSGCRMQRLSNLRQ